MSRTNEYIVNTIILFVGKFVTQFMSFLLIPLYTRYLATDDYGLIDIIQTYISLFIPILTLRFDSAVFRFLIDERDEKNGKNKIISNVMIVLFIEIILFCVIFYILQCYINIDYSLLILLNVPAIMLSNILLQVLRGLGKTKDYSIACIITGVLTLVLNLFLILVLKLNAGSILIASAIANYVCSIYICIRCNIFKYIKFNLLSKKTLKELTNYSLPMIPNALSWWIVNVSDRTIISWIIGLSANGIYTVSCKFSNLLNSVFSIFNMSWQESVSLHINDKDKDQFISSMINEILIFFISVSLIILSALPIIFNIVIGSEYRSSYNYIPILLFANIFNVFINLIGGIYVAKKETKKLASTTMISAVVNLVINLIFIKKFGLYAAAFSTLIAYVATLLYRVKDVKKYVDFKLDIKKFTLSIVLFVVVALCYYADITIINFIIFLLTIIFLLFLNKKLILQLFDMIRSKINFKKV